MSLQKKFCELARRQGNPNTITSEEFEEALSAVGIHESDAEILNRLFIMLEGKMQRSARASIHLLIEKDKAGDDQINFREFVVGIAPLITGDVMDKLSFAFNLYDLEGNNRITQAEMLFVLTSINSTASYFGDPVMTAEQIEEVSKRIPLSALPSRRHVLCH
eukprot:scaffold3541_cov252-Pinguiococcus_pyrenoidosus.AAC.9